MTDDEKETIGGMVGGGLGATAGMRLGAVLIPVPLVGPFVGGVLGAAAGSAVGRRTGRAVLDGATAFVDTLRAELDIDLPALPHLPGLPGLPGRAPTSQPEVDAQPVSCPGPPVLHTPR